MKNKLESTKLQRISTRFLLMIELSLTLTSNFKVD